MLPLSFLTYSLLMAGIALLVRRLRPEWRTARIVLLTNLPLPICAVIAAGVGVASVGPAAPGEIDASGMAIAVFMMIGLFSSFWMVALGMPASWAALHWTGRKR